MTIDINDIDPRLLEEDDRIVAYLKGKMSAEEEQQFFNELSDNPALKEKAIATARLVKGLKQVGKEQDKYIRGAFLASSEQGVRRVLDNAVREEEETQGLLRAEGAEKEYKRLEYEQERKRAEKEPVIRRRIVPWLAAAASLACIVWLGIGYNDYRKTTSLGNQFCDVLIEQELVSRGPSPSEAEKKLEQLFSDVREKRNLNNAIHELSLCWELSTMETYNDYTDFSAEIGWYLAIAYLKDNKKKEAKEVLEKMAALNNTDTAIGKKVRELQEKIAKTKK